MQRQDLNAYVAEIPLLNTDVKKQAGWLGRAIVRIEAKKVQDVRNLASRPAYLVQCVVRVRVFNEKQFGLAKEDNTWALYPAALMNSLAPSLADSKTSISLVKYSPRTINSSVSTDLGEISSSDSSATRQYTSGSAITETNSFGVNLGVDAEGDPSGGASFEHSQSYETRNERMRASVRGSSTQLSDNASMSIKDWAVYASISPPDKSDDGTNPVVAPPQNVTWLWAQQYPWDALQFRPEGEDENLVIDSRRIPKDVIARLFGTGKNAAPSHLSQFGLDFVGKASWLVTPGNWLDEPRLKMTINNQLWLGTHDNTAENKLKNTLCDDKSKSVPPDDEPQIFLEQLALLPIVTTGTSNGAVLAFGANDFHQFAGSKFWITSRANRLYAVGANFVQGVASGGQPANEVTANVPVNASAADTPNILLYFKVVDLETEYDLVFKHWVKDDTSPATISVYVNPPLNKDGSLDLTKGPQAVRYVTETEGEGGDNNVTSIALRDLSFGTADYHDYLRLGLNRIYIAVTAKAPQQYILRALAIG